MGKKTMTLLLVAVLGLGTVAQAANIIWVGDNKGYGDVEPNMPADQGWIDLLTSLGHEVSYPDQHNTEDGTQRYRTLDPNKIAELEAADLVIMSRNTDSGSYSSVADNEPNQWNAISTPIISLSAHLMRSNKWGMLNSTGTAYTMGDTHIVADASSIIFDGVAVDANGMVDVVLPDYNVDAVTDITDAGNGKALATRASDGFVMIATWEAGQAYYEGSAHVAGGARMFFAAGAGSKSSVPDGVYNLTADGEIMFINAVNYMLMKNTQVVLVSFHGGDSDPHPDAVEAGFTEAPDRGYSDLLQSAGYSVSRYITNSDPDVELLNAADLVLISRSVNSGDYSNDGATRWNSVSAPMIIMGGYPLRNSRMGYTTGGTMIDTDGDISLTVMDPEHPIFEGIALTDGTMDNLFASIVTYPTDANIVARGVSLNTDPIDDEGVVLAQISEAGGGPIGGMVIGEWKAGAELTHAGGAETDILAGNRLVFLTGSRETSGITSRTAGLYDLYEDGAQMLLNAASYMIEASKPKIVFVSFHGADDEPSGPAADVGFTEASDKAYTDLLKSQGYSVTRYITNNSPDAEILNAADLVIISRAVSSGHYSNDAATLWNSISAPMMITGGYVLRNSRMGFTTGTTMVDTTGDITLTVNDLEHPIFAGVELVDGTMVNPYAEGAVVLPTDGVTASRGISINNDPADDEGVVLAVVSEASADTGPAGGLVIAEWAAGATLEHAGGAGADVLAGDRLIFLTGSREPAGVTGGDAAGLYDLYDDGTLMFLNAVSYMLGE